ncbi:MAG TPA: GTP-binding protein [Burkholderiaceae bacterium]|nr:GTP-binding protein [Burkholderiaceae bacterium]
MQQSPPSLRVLNVLTGFLGSGKTTLLRRLLASPQLAQCAVLVNELGEIPLDHELLDRIDHETVVLRSGCICCGVRTDLADALKTLIARQDRGEIPGFDRVVLETTGLADPVPVINTVLSDPVLRHHYRVGTVVTTVDAVLGNAQLHDRHEARRQAGVADRLVITKADMVGGETVELLREALQEINPSAAIVVSHNDANEDLVRLAQDISVDTRLHEAGQWFFSRAGERKGLAARSPTNSLFGSALDEESAAREETDAETEAVNRLTSVHGDLRSVSLVLTEPLDWTAFGVWLSMFLHRYGNVTLRLKGILDLNGVDQPTVVHGVQHLLHPPVHLPAWPDGERCSRLVLIGNLPSAETLQASLAGFLSRASR